MLCSLVKLNIYNTRPLVLVNVQCGNGVTKTVGFHNVLILFAIVLLLYNHSTLFISCTKLSLKKLKSIIEKHILFEPRIS